MTKRKQVISKCFSVGDNSTSYQINDIGRYNGSKGLGTYEFSTIIEVEVDDSQLSDLRKLIFQANKAEFME